MGLPEEGIERYSLDTRAPSVDDLIVLMLRVERIEKALAWARMVLIDEVDNPPPVVSWEQIKARGLQAEADIDQLQALVAIARDKLTQIESDIAALKVGGQTLLGRIEDHEIRLAAIGA